MYKVKLHQLVWEEDFKKLDPPVKVRTLKGCKEKLSISPKRFKSLQKKFKHYRRLRVGDYRAIYRIDEGQQKVLILKVGHRKDVYKHFAQRLKHVKKSGEVGGC
ncbi:type II toxin-antitoxin system RelE/ParE family toxin [bacterium]|nr:type II toxin-antitoxin system RelE/ParE family toxin [bacterium]